MCRAHSAVLQELAVGVASELALCEVGGGLVARGAKSIVQPRPERCRPPRPVLSGSCCPRPGLTVAGLHRRELLLLLALLLLPSGFGYILDVCIYIF
jgi:hypothetical protein